MSRNTKIVFKEESFCCFMAVVAIGRHLLGDNSQKKE